MSTYDLSVRGETVHIEFKRINDSRRLPHATNKKPNLFGVRSAMTCRVALPASMSSQWWREHYPERESYLVGVSLCTRKDGWCSAEGRTRALTDALNETGPDQFRIDPEAKAGIITAFRAEQDARLKQLAKGPARQPKHPKTRRPGMRATLARMCELLEKLAHPPFVISNAEAPVDLEALLGSHPGQFLRPLSHPLIGAVRPAETAVPQMPPSPHEFDSTIAKENA